MTTDQSVFNPKGWERNNTRYLQRTLKKGRGGTPDRFPRGTPHGRTYGLQEEMNPLERHWQGPASVRMTLLPADPENMP